MCGISAIIGTNTGKILLESLKQLQNRGYDSAGICSLENSINKKFITHKYASSNDETALEKLEHVIENHNKESITVGIGHTRWATHGPKTDINSHPHSSMKGKFVIVHNGIIENYAELKKTLVTKDFTFKSQTDTEVIANLLEYNYYDILENKSNLNENDSMSLRDTLKKCVLETIQETTSQLQGTWGLTIMCLDTPNILYCTRHGSPLLVSHSEAFSMIVSEQSGFCNYVQNYIVLDNHDICYFESNFDLSENTIDSVKMKMISGRNYKINRIQNQNRDITPHPYPHWTLKEIHEQVDSSLRAISMGGRLLSNNKVKLGGIEDYKNTLVTIDNIILLGCGTSYHAGMVGVSYFKELNNFNNVQLFDGADFLPRDIPKLGETALIFLSQSGETKDLHRCIEIGKTYNCFMIGVVNVPDSMIAREVHCGCYLNAGREVAVASTKSFTSQLIILSMLSIWFSQHKNSENYKRLQYVKDLRRLHLDIDETINISLEKLDNSLLELFSYHSCFILGKGKGKAIAFEGSLKIKEISYIHSEGYSASSLKHGPFALLEKGFPVILLDINQEYKSKIKNAYEEIKSRHANVVLISNNPVDYAEHNIVIPFNESYSELLSNIILQMLAYKLSVKRGINPDLPKNLAKVVTVE